MRSASSAPSPTRCIVLWFPDWPVTAWARAEKRPDRPVAVLHGGRVIACSPEARTEGVADGMRKREAQSRCPALVTVPADPARDAREFAAVVTRIEQSAPGVQLLRPGVAVLRSRGPARYFGGEAAAAAVLRGILCDAGLPDVRAGIADGPFTAELAAQLATPQLVVPAGETAAFLAPLPIAALGDATLTSLLPRLGVRTLGDFAALEEDLVRDRFGERGVRLRALASGGDSQPVTPRIPPPELARDVHFEPPIALAEQIAFSIRQTAEEFIAGLVRERLVCTELSVTLTDENGHRSERVWVHPQVFDAPAVIDRVRWQLDAAETLTGPVSEVRLDPVAVDAAAHHEPGLFGGGVDERVHHVLSRVQAMLGPAGVVVPELGGGRWLAERQRMVPWGQRETGAPPQDRPWPGSLPSPLPATVFRHRRPVEVLDGAGHPLVPTARGELPTAPGVFIDGARRARVTGWAGPWPIAERGWDPARARTAVRIQLVADDGTAWLLACEDELWWAEGRYD